MFVRLVDGGEIVRYNKERQWWLEYVFAFGKPGRQVSVATAAQLAADMADVVYTGLAGGKTFYRHLSLIMSAQVGSENEPDEKPT